MKTVILCGGLGTRLREETEYRPKAMIKIGDSPILWHIMRIYIRYGFSDFILCLGYKGDMIKEYFYNFDILNNDFTMRIGKDSNIEIHNDNKKDHQDNKYNFTVTLVDTGENSLKGSRLKQIEKYIDSDTFMVTYGDGVSNINISDLIKFHRFHNKIATMTGVHPPSRFGTLTIGEGENNKNKIIKFREKPGSTKDLINGGFFVFNREIFDYLSTDDSCDLEIGVFDTLVDKGELMVYRHTGEWMCMDTINDMEYLNGLWSSGNAFWRLK